MGSIKSDTLHGVKWSGLSNVSNTIVNFLLGIILARLLDPSDYGVVGMTAIFFAIAGIFVDGGLAAALVRKKDLSQKDCSTVFFFNLATSTFFYIILFIGSPYIAVFLKAPILKEVIRVSALTMIIGSFGSIHFVLLTKKINFKPSAILNVSLNILNGIIGIILAYNGFGVWALVIPNVVCSIIRTVSIWFISTWRPSMIFSFKSFKEMFAFGGNLVVNAIFDKLYNEGTSMVIGRFYTPQMLGYYSKGMSTAQLPSISLFSIVGSVTYPVLSKIQDDNDTLTYVYGRYIRILSMVSFFVIILLAALAHPYISFLYSDKWEAAAIFLQLFCFRYLLYHIHAVNWSLLLVKGRSDIALKKEVINKTIRFILLACSIPFGVIAICISQIIGSIIDLMVNTYYANKVCGMGLIKQASDFMPYLIISAIACLPAYGLTFININNIFTLLIGGTLSCILYWGYLWIKKDESLLSLIELTPLKKYIRISHIGA